MEILHGKLWHECCEKCLMCLECNDCMCGEKLDEDNKFDEFDQDDDN